MNTIYISTIFATALACLLTSLLLFARRKSGERSRVILACIVFFSVANYITRFIDIIQGAMPQQVISVPMYLLALFMIICYILYPIEIISLGYLNTRRMLVLYSPLALLTMVYALCLNMGITFPLYHTLPHMISSGLTFDVCFRLLLTFMLFCPILFVFATPYTKRYNNTDRAWIRKYTIVFTINILAYVAVLMSENVAVKIMYYYISSGCSIYIAYLELFVRIIDLRQANCNETNEQKPDHREASEPTDAESAPASAPKQRHITNPSTVPKRSSLCERIVCHMNQTSDYRNPELTLSALASSLCTNRTTLAKALREMGYSSFNDYVNSLRINEFISYICEHKTNNYQNAFFDVGFRSRTTALRNFKHYTRKTPSEYFRNI